MGVEGVEVILLVFCFEEAGEEVAGYDLRLWGVGVGLTVVVGEVVWGGAAYQSIRVCIFVQYLWRALDAFCRRRRRHELHVGLPDEDLRIRRHER